MNGLFDGLFDGVAEAGPGVAIRATVLFVVASLVSLAMAKASAAQRHLVWVAALMGAMVLPAIHAWGPEWPVWPVGMTLRHESMTERHKTATKTGAPTPDEPAAFATSAVSARSPRQAEPAMSQAMLPVAAQAAGTVRTVSLRHGVAAVWLVGVIYGCLRLAVAYAGIRQLARRGDPAGGRTAAMIAELAAAAGIRRRVRGLVSRESIVPMTWGWLRPVVLLPAEAGSWSAERLRVVLQHELAHVSRWDALTQFVAELARSVYWFHPLSWWSVRRLRAEQEAACDDCVLAAGAAADDYAEELLAVTARLPRVAYGLQGTGVAVAMGRAGRLEDRVRALLAFDRDRRPVDAWRAAAVAGVFAAVATLAAIIGPAADAEDKATNGPAEPGEAAAPGSQEPADDLLRIRSLTPEEAARIIREKQYQPQWKLNAQGSSLNDDPKELRATLSGMGFTAMQIEALMDEIENLPKLEEPFFRAVCSGVSPSLAYVLNRCSDFLVLPAVDTLDEATAAALAGEEMPFRRRMSNAVHDLHLPGISSLDAKAAMALVRGNVSNLSLRGLKSIDAATAKALASGNLAELDLSGLRSLGAETARELAQGTIQRDGRGSRRLAGLKSLDLSGLESLDAATARALADGEVKTLFLSGLRSLDADAAKALGAKGNWQQLDLRSLRSLDVDTAKALSRAASRELNGELNLSGVQTLDAGTAAALVTGDQCFRPDLSGLRSLDAETARALVAGIVDRLDLSGLRSIDIDTAKALGNRKDFCFLTLAGLTALDADTAGALMSGEGAVGQLLLPGLLALDATTAAALARGGAFYLGLSGLQSLDADTAQALTNGKALDPARRRDFDLSGIRSLQPAAAEALVKGLDCRTCHDTATLPELLRSGCTNYFGPQPRLFIGRSVAVTPAGIADDMPEDTDTIESLTVQQARTLVETFPGMKVTMNQGVRVAGRMPLNGLTSLRPEVARVLAEYVGEEMALDGLTTLDADTAQALAECKCQRLSLRGLTALGPGAAEALAESKAWTGELTRHFFDKLGDKIPLTEQSARVVAASRSERFKVSLPCVTAFESPDSVAIAKALATRKGPLALPNLKKISPKTLSALIEKQDIDIPLIETLELIPEPDGSPTEDFVIPERFQNR